MKKSKIQIKTYKETKNIHMGRQKGQKVMERLVKVGMKFLALIGKMFDRINLAIDIGRNEKVYIGMNGLGFTWISTLHTQ